MGVISMQVMRQYNGVGQSKSKPEPSSSSQKSVGSLYPQEQYPAVDEHSSRKNRRCSSPSHQSSIKGRPPRHPDSDSPLSISSSPPALSGGVSISISISTTPINEIEIVYTKSLDFIIDEYKNEKFPPEILARLQRKRVNNTNNCDASTNDKDEQRDEDNEEYTTSIE